MKNIYIKHIARLLEVKEWQVENCAKLFEEGATIPFVSRYRKERTGGLDEVEWVSSTPPVMPFSNAHRTLS